MNSSVRATYWGPNTQFGVVAFPEQRSIAEQRGWKVDGQEETCPTTGKKHYQFWVKTPQVRMSEVKKVFQGAHIEVARNVKAVQNYCAKEETRSGVLPDASDKYPNQDKLFKLFGEWIMKTSGDHKRWLYDDDGIRRRNVRGDIWLEQFDRCCGVLIERGYRVESLAVNPAVRSAIKKFGNAIFERFVNERGEASRNRRAVDRQTDRQTEIISQSDTTDENAQGEDTEGEERTDASSSAHDSGSCVEDDLSSSDAGHTQGTGPDSCEESDFTGDSE